MAGLVLATTIALAVAHSVYRVPIQVDDSLDVILVSRHPPTSLDLFTQALHWSPSTLRPMRYVQARALSQLADTIGITHHAAFRGTHAALVLALVWLFVWVVRPQAWTDVAALALALTVLFGLHTFDAMMRESFPINHFAQVAATTLFMAGVAIRPPRAALQVASLLLLGWMLLLVESAVLIWIVLVTSVALGMPGFRRWTAVAATLVLIVFLAARPLLDISAPMIGSHSSGWGATTLSGEELAVRFTSNPWPFFAYNVVGGALSLLASEPRFGVYQLLAAQPGALAPVVVVNIVSSLLATAVVIVCGVSLLRRSPRTWATGTQLLALGVVTALASALLCVAYIKDDILSTGGVFYAVMSYIAVQWVLTRNRQAATTASIIVLAGCLVPGSALWAWRAVGLHYDLRRAAFTSRNDWVLRTDRELAGGESAGPEDVALAVRLRSEALAQGVTSPSFLPDWGERYWVE